MPRIVLALMLLGGAFIMYAEYRALKLDSRAEPIIKSTADFRPVIGNSYALRSAARQAGPIWGTDPEAATALISRYLTEYPLETRGWLDLARIEASLHGPESPTLAGHLEAAVAVRPRSRSTRWQATQIALQSGDFRLAEQHLARWLEGEPRDTSRALFIARRWIDDADELLDRIVPAEIDFLSRAMSFALGQDDSALINAIWKRVEDQVDLDDPIFLSYVDHLFSQGDHDRAIALWARHDQHYRPGAVANGEFARPLGPSRGLNWQVGRLPNGVAIERDKAEFYYRPASLLVAFDGQHNPRLRAPSIRIPVTPGTHYELAGYWKAEGLTTRALPFWLLSAEGARMSERVDVPAEDFDWTRWSVTFQTPEDVRMLRLRLNRSSTSAFDRYIEGRLWLDGIQLTELPQHEPAEALSD